MNFKTLELKPGSVLVLEDNLTKAQSDKFKAELSEHFGFEVRILSGISGNMSVLNAVV